MSSKLSVEDIARVCHEVNRAYCIALNDYSQAPWESTSEELRKSAINGVRFVLDSPQGGPAASHQNWVDEKRKAGWCYGRIKDSAKKTHPCLVPFAQLPITQRVKDYIFRAVVLALSEPAPNHK